jgi:hypothetical protein
MVKKIGALIIPFLITLVLLMGNVGAAVTLDDPTTSENITAATFNFDITSNFNTTNITGDYIDIWYFNSGSILLGSTDAWVVGNSNRTWNKTLTVSGIADGAYTFWASHRNANGTTQNSSNTSIVGLDDTGPSSPVCTWTPSNGRVNLGDRISISCTSTDTAFTSDQISMTFTSATDSVTSAAMSCSGTNPTTCTYNFPDPIRRASTHSVTIVGTDQHSQTTTVTSSFSVVEDGNGNLVLDTEEFEAEAQNRNTIVVIFIVIVVIVAWRYTKRKK